MPLLSISTITYDGDLHPYSMSLKKVIKRCVYIRYTVQIIISQVLLQLRRRFFTTGFSILSSNKTSERCLHIENKYTRAGFTCENITNHRSG